MTRNVIRECLSNRRETEGIPFETDGQSYHAHVGRYSDGRVAEIFVTSAKVGASVDTAARESSTVLSIALQYGANFDAIRKALPRDPRGEAIGPLGCIMDILSREDEVVSRIHQKGDA